MFGANDISAACGFEIELPFGISGAIGFIVSKSTVAVGLASVSKQNGSRLFTCFVLVAGVDWPLASDCGLGVDALACARDK